MILKILPILDIILNEGSYKNSELYYMNNNSARNPLLNNPERNSQRQ